MCLFPEVVFQFHKVQLKESSQSFKQCLHLFQFHKVQLKALEDTDIAALAACFNSIRYN